MDWRPCSDLTQYWNHSIARCQERFCGNAAVFQKFDVAKAKQFGSKKEEKMQTLAPCAAQRQSWKQLPLHRANHVSGFTHKPQWLFFYYNTVSWEPDFPKVILQNKPKFVHGIYSHSPMPSRPQLQTRWAVTRELGLPTVSIPPEHTIPERSPRADLAEGLQPWGFREHRIPGVHGTKESRDDFLAFFPAGLQRATWGARPSWCRVLVISQVFLSLALHDFTLGCKVKILIANPLLITKIYVCIHCQTFLKCREVHRIKISEVLYTHIYTYTHKLGLKICRFVSCLLSPTSQKYFHYH